MAWCWQSRPPGAVKAPRKEGRGMTGILTKEAMFNQFYAKEIDDYGGVKEA